MKPKGTSLFSQDFTSYPYPEPDESCPQSSLFFQIEFNILHLSISKPSMWFLSLRFTDQNCFVTSYMSHLYYISCPYLVKSANYGAPLYAVFSSFLSLSQLKRLHTKLKLCMWDRLDGREEILQNISWPSLCSVADLSISETEYLTSIARELYCQYSSYWYTTHIYTQKKLSFIME